ncbi:hypothetical protein KXR64_20865, partial [Brucella intermedia]
MATMIGRERSTHDFGADCRWDTRGARTTRARDRSHPQALFLFAGAWGPARLADLPKALDAPKSTIYDLVNILSEAGLLEVKDARVYFGKVMQLYGASYLRA